MVGEGLVSTGLRKEKGHYMTPLMGTPALMLDRKSWWFVWCVTSRKGSTLKEQQGVLNGLLLHKIHCRNQQCLSRLVDSLNLDTVKFIQVSTSFLCPN